MKSRNKHTNRAAATFWYLQISEDNYHKNNYAYFSRITVFILLIGLVDGSQFGFADMTN